MNQEQADGILLIHSEIRSQNAIPVTTVRYGITAALAKPVTHTALKASP